MHALLALVVIAAPALAGCALSHERAGPDAYDAGGTGRDVRRDAGTLPHGDSGGDTDAFDAGGPPPCVAGRADLEGVTPLGPASMFANAAIDEVGGSDCPTSSLVVRASPGVPTDYDTPAPSLEVYVDLPVDVTVTPWSGMAPARATFTSEDGRTFDTTGEVVMGSADSAYTPGGRIELFLALYGDGTSVRGVVQAGYCTIALCI